MRAPRLRSGSDHRDDSESEDEAPVSRFGIMAENCLAVLGLGCVCCCQYQCSIERTRAALAFMPPRPTYRVEALPGCRALRIVYAVRELQDSQLHQRAAEQAEVSWVSPRLGCKLPVVWLRAGSLEEGGAAGRIPPAAPSHESEGPLVMLHSHANATDVGIMMGHYYELSRLLGIDVVGVEYTGYGASEGGRLHTSNIGVDIEAAYDMVVTAGVPPSRIVAYGQSVGTAPACRLAARRPVGGLILHSPLASALKVIDPHPSSFCKPSCILCCLDIFRSDREILNVKAPVLIMHGFCDEVVPFHNAQRLHDRCQPVAKTLPHFVQQAGHNDLVETDPHAYIERMESFLADVRRRDYLAGIDPNREGPPGCAAECIGAPTNGSAEKPGQDEMGGTGPASEVELPARARSGEAWGPSSGSANGCCSGSSAGNVPGKAGARELRAR